MEGLFTWLEATSRPQARPTVTVSYAQSLDGSIAAPGGSRLILSGPGSMRMTHRLRGAHDAIMVGIGTVLTDDPQLTVRQVQGKNPRPFVVDTHLRTPPNARVLRAGRPAVIVAAEGADGRAHDSLVAAGAQVLVLPTTPDGLIHLPELVTMLESLHVRRLMVEGGAKLITSFLNARLVDRMVITVCPCLVGGLHATEPLRRSPSGEFPRLNRPHSTVIGDDMVIWGELAQGSI